MSDRLDPGTPLLVGVGVADDGGIHRGARRPDEDGAEAVELMTVALEAAAHDAGARSLLGAIDRIAVPQGTWSYTDPARLVASRVGAPAARTHLAELGVSQQTLVSDALRAIAAGESEVAVVVGGEARPRGRRAERAGGTAPEIAQRGVVPDVVHRREPEFFAAAEIAAGIVVPVQQYALIESALRSVEGQPLGEHRRQIANLWARNNEVARTNPHAAFPESRSALAIDTPGPDNRPMAFPYNKWHASQMTVDQAGALLLCSSKAAREHRVPTDRWMFPLVSIDASHAVSLSRRRYLHRWPAMKVLGQAASERVGRSLGELEFVEVYSCFPSAVRVQQRELGLPLHGVPTITGGMTFAGGPFNNFVYQATAAMVPRLRAVPGSLGMVTTVCGLLTKPGVAIWSARPDGVEPLLSDFGNQAARETPTVEVVEEHCGPARIAAYTVTYDGQDPVRVIALCDLSNGQRCVAVTDDAALAAEAQRSELVGTEVSVVGTTFG